MPGKSATGTSATEPNKHALLTAQVHTNPDPLLPPSRGTGYGSLTVTLSATAETQVSGVVFTLRDFPDDTRYASTSIEPGTDWELTYDPDRSRPAQSAFILSPTTAEECTLTVGEQITLTFQDLPLSPANSHPQLDIEEFTHSSKQRNATRHTHQPYDLTRSSALIHSFEPEKVTLANGESAALLWSGIGATYTLSYGDIKEEDITEFFNPATGRGRYTTKPLHDTTAFLLTATTGGSNRRSHSLTTAVTTTTPDLTIGNLTVTGTTTQYAHPIPIDYEWTVGANWTPDTDGLLTGYIETATKDPDAAAVEISATSGGAARYRTLTQTYFPVDAPHPIYGSITFPCRAGWTVHVSPANQPCTATLFWNPIGTTNPTKPEITQSEGLIKNGGFNKGWHPWNTHGGTKFGTSDGRRVAIIGSTHSDSSIEQYVSGLIPGNKYRLSAWLRDPDGICCVGVKGYGGKEKWTYASAGDLWKRIDVEFAPVDHNGATVYIWRKRAHDVAYCDKVSLAPSPWLYNGDFEKPHLRGWTVQGPVERSAEQPYQGGYCAKIPGGVSSTCEVSQKVTGLTAGQWYALNGRINDPEGTTGLLVQYDNSTKYCYPPAGGWQNATITFCPPSDCAAKVYFLRSWGSKRNAYVDDITFTLHEPIPHVGHEGGEGVHV
ncbi:hypothetical protein [Streptomyces sp. NPDC051577]|uniref:hypothetical protein n=1 Tax=Streptomyces sp. NPDC051577 TaxID=3155166 RepID=UPI00344A4EAF